MSNKIKTADPLVTEILTIADSAAAHIRQGCNDALRAGLRLLHLHLSLPDNEPGGFKAALDAMETHNIARSTAYRWINAAAAALAKIQQLPTDATREDLIVPVPGTKEFAEAEKLIELQCKGISLRRLMLGSVTTSDESRLDELITHAEAGDIHAEAALAKVASGELTLVQAIRAQAGAKATKEKSRKDPVYLDIDGRTGEAKGLFCKSLITISNTFQRWDHLDETARQKAKQAWKEVVSHLPKELR